ncbi:uncharacterized protein LOC119588380 [Penaeus monodon]|uniref:uncharacterized protein LOC119588380 n=1 Tax=Penaeus monodon TaxID=6687 RepID=UPI0018A7A91E|nr:uncharacterized protein LOC119588380 [Penaeus monodon]
MSWRDRQMFQRDTDSSEGLPELDLPRLHKVPRTLASTRLIVRWKVRGAVRSPYSILQNWNTLAPSEKATGMMIVAEAVSLSVVDSASSSAPQVVEVNWDVATYIPKERPDMSKLLC